MTISHPVLAFDFGSPRASCAVALDGRTVAAADAERLDRDADLLSLIAACLGTAGNAPSELGGIVALSGPGSFTGLRIACATALGLHLATGVPATAVSSLEALALAAPAGSGPVLAVVDALRGECFTQRFDRGAGDRLEPTGEPGRRPAAEIVAEPAVLVVGDSGIERIAKRFSGGTGRTLAVDRLAAVVAEAASRSRWRWDVDSLRRPHYLRAAAVRKPA